MKRKIILVILLFAAGCHSKELNRPTALTLLKTRTYLVVGGINSGYNNREQDEALFAVLSQNGLIDCEASSGKHFSYICHPSATGNVFRSGRRGGLEF
jgi:hypothetical protein